MGKIRLDGYVCERCIHKWVPRDFSKKLPLVCPKCKSPYWNIPKKKKRDKREGGKK
jgi:DNA-directed RNA polymerase subunit RPC12/RpoP